jgi:hypothetical protein
MNPKHNPHIAETINLPTQPALQHDVSCVGFLSLSFLFSTSLLFDEQLDRFDFSEPTSTIDTAVDFFKLLDILLDKFACDLKKICLK